MKEYDFTLKFDLPTGNEDPANYVDALYEAGCDDASIGIGQKGRIALNFIRESESAMEAITSAISNVKSAIPDAKLIEATPDLVGVTDIADIVGCTRQNIRKLVIAHKTVFPTPLHEGNYSIWNLFKVLSWMQRKGNYDIPEVLVEVSDANMQINLARNLKDAKPEIQRNLEKYLHRVA